MRKRIVARIASTLAFLALSAVADEAPTIGGAATITANTQGAIINVSGADSGGTTNAKQAVASVLTGSIAGALQDTVGVQGTVVNVSGALSGSAATACQSVGTIGSDCGN